MNKSEYRRYFASCMNYVKITKIAKEAGIHVSNMSKFLKGSEYDFLMSEEKCRILYNAINDTLSRIIA